MKRIVFAVLVAAALMSCNIHVEKTGYVEAPRPLTGFERIVLMGSINVKYVQADSFSVKVHAPNVEEMMKVETTVEGNVLKIGMKNNLHFHFFHFYSDDADDVTVYVTSPDFLGISLMGSGDFMCVQPLDTDTLSIDLKGSGDISFKDVICDRVNVSVVGSGDVTIDRVTTQQAQLDIVGSGDIGIGFENSGVVDARVKGSGDIDLKGTVRRLNRHVRGSGDIDTNKLTVRQ